MTLYMITGDNRDGNNLDAVVRASTPKRAVELWKAHFEVELDELEYAGRILPAGYYPGSKIPHATIWEFEGLTSSNEGVLPWVHNGETQNTLQGNMIAVGYVLN